MNLPSNDDLHIKQEDGENVFDLRGVWKETQTVPPIHHDTVPPPILHWKTTTTTTLKGMTTTTTTTTTSTTIAGTTTNPDAPLTDISLDKKHKSPELTSA